MPEFLLRVYHYPNCSVNKYTGAITSTFARIPTHWTEKSDTFTLIRDITGALLNYDVSFR